MTSPKTGIPASRGRGAPAHLYPPIEPYRDGWFAAGDGHDLYVAECGNPDGEPVLIVHGGPGGGCNPTLRRYHDPSKYRIILLDQRGCGRSVPHASLEANTTWHLVADMELLRENLGVQRWQLFGGSWGSTLALAYAERHPERVSSMVLRGIFLVSPEELRWFYQGGAGRFFPDAWDAFEAPIPVAERGDMIGAYARRLFDASPDVYRPAAEAWSVWEGRALSLIEDPARTRMFAEPAYALAFARIECHYFVNGGFFTRETGLLENAGRLKGIPAVIVHGRYDMVTPIASAVRLKAAWPEAELQIVPAAGHAITEPGIAAALVEATKRFSGVGRS